MTIPRALRTLVAVLQPILGATALAIGALWLFRRWVPPEALRASGPEVGNYLQTLGSIYAVLLAFVVYVVWGQFNDARAIVEREANELMDLHRIADGFPDQQRHGLHQALRHYIDAVIDEEWTAMARGDEETSSRIGKILDGAWAILHTFAPHNECHSALFTEALTRFNDLSDLRTARLTAARSRIPLAMNFLIYFGAVVVVGSLFLLPVDRFAIHAVLTGALAGAVAHILYLIWDLDHAFAGDWRISRAAFRRVQRAIESHAG